MNMNQDLEESTEAAREAVSLVTEKLDIWYQGLVSNLPNIVVALSILAAFWLLSRLSRRLVSRVLGRLSVARSVAKLLSTLMSIAVLIGGLFVALSVLHLDKTVTSLLAGAGVLGIVLGFAFQDIAADLLAGILLAVRKPFVHGDLIETNGSFGAVRDVNLRTTILNTPQGQIVLIPNREVFTNKVINYTHLGHRRVDLPVGVSYAEDLEQVREVAVAAISEVSSRNPKHETELLFDAFGDSSINLTVRFWIDFHHQVDYRKARSEAIVRIHQAFGREGISIPFPIRTLDFGITGGEPLSAMLAATEPPLQRPDAPSSSASSSSASSPPE